MYSWLAHEKPYLNRIKLTLSAPVFLAAKCGTTGQKNIPNQIIAFVNSNYLIQFCWHYN
jgi:hypothetical protein